MSIYDEKVRQVQDLLDEYSIDTWLIYVRETAEHTDPVLKVLGPLGCVWPAAFMFNRDGQRIAITGQGDDEAVRSTGLFDKVLYYQLSIQDTLLEVLSDWDPQTIGVNFSQSDVSADGLTYGMWLNLQKYLKDTPYAERLVSAEMVAEAVRGRKSPAELDAMRASANDAMVVFDALSAWLKPGVSEKEIHAWVTQRVEDMGLTMSWDAAHCPGLNAGPGSPWGHFGASDEVTSVGNTLNMDFGVTKDGWCSDNQRVWYFLRDGETDAPDSVKTIFYAVRDGIQKAFDFVKPGVQGWEVDAVARQHIFDAGYEEYPHALGHAVGRYAHDGGVGFYPRWERYGDKPFGLIAAGNVFTLEFGVRSQYGYISIEEMIVVTENGAEWLVPPQKEMILVQS